MKSIKTVLKWLARLIGYPIMALTLWGLLAPLMVSPVYNFPDPQPFAGEGYYNPYADMDPALWKKGNFQIQTRMAGGLTNGRNNLTSDVYREYGALDYDIITISDYMRINRDSASRADFIPVYEHGISFGKQHQVLIGATHVLWLDFPFYQTIHNKQYILNLLRDDARAVAIAHPSFSTGYSLKDMAKLGNYDLVETLNALAFSPDHWDAALSSGKPVFLVANDDAHNLNNPRQFGVRVSAVNTAEVTEKAVCEALLKGHAYGYHPAFTDLKTDEEITAYKLKNFRTYPKLELAEMRGDTFELAVDQPVKKVVFKGQNGAVLKETKAGEKLSYVFKPSDTYVRAEVTVKGGGRMFLNPVFRSVDGQIPEVALPSINWIKTLVYRVPIWLLVLIVAFRFMRPPGRYRRHSQT